MVLTQADIDMNLKDSDGWSQSGSWIEKEYRFSSYPKAIQFIREIADTAEDRQHHPYTIIDHTTVILKLSTLDEGGLTQKDFESAHAYDRIFAKYT
ncbi:4a-hydroxytetrahydrobiopterin dehydratase [Alkalicoccus chagannorensis]|uniref:4a-hydroxytetrahydrobiopterin dehydratase n=1 Tax=Alkalicoccus chagannorensis TaxID=427072 RepID=UPI0004789E46|nr:4a-hydroxytetrahydrobiopterin dehydratase [Alkalicoccus chagannorensis]